MSKLDRHAGLLDAHDILVAHHDELISEFEVTRPNIFGGPTRRHREIIAISRSLKKLDDKIVVRGAEIVAKEEAA